MLLRMSMCDGVCSHFTWGPTSSVRLSNTSHKCCVGWGPWCLPTHVSAIFAPTLTYHSQPEGNRGRPACVLLVADPPGRKAKLVVPRVFCLFFIQGDECRCVPAVPKMHAIPTHTTGCFSDDPSGQATVHPCCLYTWVTLACPPLISSAQSKFSFTFPRRAPVSGGCGSRTL